MLNFFYLKNKILEIRIIWLKIGSALCNLKKKKKKKREKRRKRKKKKKKHFQWKYHLENNFDEMAR